MEVVEPIGSFTASIETESCSATPSPGVQASKISARCGGHSHVLERLDTDCWVYDIVDPSVYSKKHTQVLYTGMVQTINTFRSRGLPRKEGEEVAGRHDAIR